MGYHTDHIQQLEDELDAVKTDLAHEVNTLVTQRDEYKEHCEMLGDAADYWKETFDGFYGAIYNIAASPLETQDIVLKIIDKLLTYKGDYEK